MVVGPLLGGFWRYLRRVSRAVVMVATNTVDSSETMRICKISIDKKMCKFENG